MNSRLIIGIVAVLLMATSVSAWDLTKPIPDFTSNVVSGYAPLTVKFTDVSFGNLSTVTGYSWSYNCGEGWKEFSTEQNPTYTFTKRGTRYYIALTLYTTAYGKEYVLNSKKDYITVYGYVTTPKFTIYQVPHTARLQFTDVSSAYNPNDVTGVSWYYRRSSSPYWIQFSTAKNPVKVLYYGDFEIKYRIYTKNSPTGYLESTQWVSVVR